MPCSTDLSYPVLQLVKASLRCVMVLREKKQQAISAMRRGDSPIPGLRISFSDCRVWDFPSSSPLFFPTDKVSGIKWELTARDFLTERRCSSFPLLERKKKRRNDASVLPTTNEGLAYVQKVEKQLPSRRLLRLDNIRDFACIKRYIPWRKWSGWCIWRDVVAESCVLINC